MSPSAGARARISTAQLVVAVSLTAVACWLAAAVAASSIEAPAAWRIVLLAAMIPLSELALLHLRFGHDRFSFTWGEASVVVAFSVVGPEWFVALCPPFVLCVHLLARRGLVKSLYNCATFTVAASIALVVVRLLVDGPLHIVEPIDALALLLACTTFSVTSHLLTCLVVAVSQGVPLRGVVVEALNMSALVWGGNVVVGAAVLLLVERSPSTLLALPALMLAVYLMYRAYLGARQERDVWQQLEAATRELNLLDESDVATAALRRAGQLFRTDHVELVLDSTARRSARRYVLDGDAVLGTEDDAPPRPGCAQLTVVQVTGDGKHPAGTCLVAPLEGPRGRVGDLRLLFAEPVSLTGRERQVLLTFAHAVSTTVLNAALYDEARTEAARHAYQATHDALTGLANRTLLNARTEAALAGSAGTTTALLLLDLDHFKEINDTLGHAAGDVLLQEIGARLRRFVRATDVVARLGGDEFALLLTGLDEPAQAGPVAEALLRLLAEPVEFEGVRLSVEGSLGVACYPQDAGTAEELFRRADVAMYQAKSSRGSWLRYSADRDDSSVHRQALVAELRAALQQDQLVVHYQPQIDLETRLVVGAEALCRWDHPTRGMLPPTEFVAVAEESGLVRPFTLWVLETAVAECVTWQGERPLSIAVNLSARSLLDPKLPEDVAGVLNRHGLAPDRLILEITETTAASDLPVVEGVLAQLRRLGVEISVDDFGTGYSSLAFLQRTAVNELKVDRSFVAGMLTSENDLALVRTTVQLAHSLGARSVAEGVEDSAMAAALRDMGCDVAQGFWLSQPLPAAGLRELLTLHIDLDAVPTRPAVVRLDAEARRLRSVGTAPIARSGS